MDYDFQQKKFLLDTHKLEKLGHTILYAIRNVREAGNLPLKPFEHRGMMKPAHFAECALLDIARELGIVLGTFKTPGLGSYGELDVSKQE